MICCHDGKYNCDLTPGGPGGPVGSWRATLVWEHSPGFFSCERFQNEVFMGTYETCLGFKAQLIRLSDQKILRTFTSTESIYHIRNQGDSYCYVACEQGNLYKMTDINGSLTLIESQTYPMGYYDACDGDGHRYSVEKKSVGPPNQVKFRRDGASWVDGNFGCKEILYNDGKLWIGAYNLSNDYKCALS